MTKQAPPTEYSHDASNTPLQEQETPSRTANVRDARFRAGRITADVYLNQTSNGQMFSVSLYASYRDNDGQWQRSQSFRASDLPMIESTVRRAYDHCERHRDKVYYNDRENDDQDKTRKKPEPQLSLDR